MPVDDTADTNGANAGDDEPPSGQPRTPRRVPLPPSERLEPRDDNDAFDHIVDGPLTEKRTFEGSLLVRGDVASDVSLTVDGRLRVIGWVDPGAVVRVRGVVEILGGIKGATLECDGPITVESVVDSRVRAIGELRVLIGVRDSDVSVVGSVSVSDGGIIGGTTVATDRIAVQMLGEPPPVGKASWSQRLPRTTLVRISYSAVRDQRLHDLAVRQEELEGDLDQLEALWLPMIEEAASGDLTDDEQRELDLRRRQIDSTRQRIVRIETDRNDLEPALERKMSASPRVRVARRLFPGVDVRIWTKIYQFDQEVDGPIDITPSSSVSDRASRIARESGELTREPGDPPNPGAPPGGGGSGPPGMPTP